MTLILLVFLSTVFATSWSWPVTNNNTNIVKAKNETLTTSTTTPPSVLFPPKPYLLFENLNKKSPTSTQHEHHTHHHSVIKLPKIQIHKVYYTSESAPPVSTVAKPRNHVYFKDDKNPGRKIPDFSMKMVANETKRYTQVAEDDDDGDHLQYQQQNQEHHYHPHPHPHSHLSSSSANDHQNGYNPAVLEDEGSFSSLEEPLNDEPEMNQRPSPPQMQSSEPSPHDEGHSYGIPQIPPPLYSLHPQGFLNQNHGHQVLPPEALKQVLRPALSNEMLDDELAQINRQIITGYQNNRDSFEQYLKKMNHHAKAVSLFFI